MIARTNTNGVTKITIAPRKKQLQRIFNKMLDDEELRVKFTKTSIQKKYELTQPEAYQFIHFAEEKERLFLHDKTGKKWEEHAFAITEPAAQNTMMSVWMMSVWDVRSGCKKARAHYVVHKCDRCHQFIPGKGRHNKSARGHTKEICDLAMVGMLHQI